MAEFRITIVGLGVLGTSLGLALKKASSEIQIVGHDREPDAASAARKAGAVDRTEWNLPTACRGAGIVILALPLPAIRDTLAVIGPDLSEGCLVTDTAPLKVPVIAAARELLPNHVAFVGGSPVGARGGSQASAELFTDTTYCLCPEPSTPADAVDRASDLALALGARPHFLDAAEHDGLVALLDSLPYMLALAAMRSAHEGDTPWRDIVKLGCGRFDQLLDVLGDNPATGLDAAVANATNVSRWLDRAQETLDEVRALLEAEPAAREEAIKRLAVARDEWERHGDDAQAPLPNVGFSLRKLFWFGK